MLHIVSYFHQKLIKAHFMSVKNLILKKLIFINKKKIQKTRRFYFVLALIVEVINYVELVLCFIFVFSSISLRWNLDYASKMVYFAFTELVYCLLSRNWNMLCPFPRRRSDSIQKWLASKNASLPRFRMRTITRIALKKQKKKCGNVVHTLFFRNSEILKYNKNIPKF